MGIVIRQSIKSVAITMGGVILGAVVAVLSIHFFPQSQLGFRESLIKVSSWATYLGIFGFNFTVLILGQKYPPGHKARGTFLTITAVIPAVLCLLVCAGIFLFKPWLLGLYKEDDAILVRQYFVLFPLLTIMTAVIAWMESYLQALNKTAMQNLAREILARIIYIALLLLFGWQIISFDQFIWLYVILYIVPFLFLLIIAMRHPGFSFNYQKGLISKAELKEIWWFSGYHMLTVASTVLLMQLDAFMLGPLDSLKAVGIYSIATLAISMMRNPIKVIGVAATPSFSQSYNRGDFEELRGLFSRSAVNIQIIGFGLFALVYINAGNIGKLLMLLNDGYGQVTTLMMILMVGQLFDMVTGLNFEMIGVTKYYRFNFWIAIMLMVIVLVLNFFLITSIGIYGAAVATSIGLIIFNLAKAWFLWKKMQMQPFNRTTLYVMAVTGCAGVLAWLIPYLGSPFADAILRSAVFAAFSWWMLYKIKASAELNGITDNLIRKRKLF